MTEQEIFNALSAENEEFKKLGREHRELDSILAELNGRVYLTPEEEMEKKRLQKLKLQKKDRMAELIRKYKKSHSLN
ncbi:MAG: YdcH family protein [Nitrospirae bacterium]|nr:YdcH family protein [Nitrospirota bacterium]